MTFLESFDAYHDTVYRVALSYTRSVADAEDICQDVFVKALERRKDIPPEKEKSWLITVTVNRCRDMFRSPWRKRTVPLEEAAAFAAPEEGELFARVMRLKRPYRMVIYLHYYEGYSLAEISGQLGESENAVKMRLYRARQALKKLLEEENFCEYELT